MRIGEILTEANIVNNKTDIEFEYDTTNEEGWGYSVMSSADDISSFVTGNRDKSEAVGKWFATVFRNWAMTQEDFLVPIDDFLTHAASTAFDNSDGYEPDYDDQDELVEEFRRQLPAWAQAEDAVVLFGYDFHNYYDGDQDTDFSLAELADYLDARVANGGRIERMSVPDAVRLSQQWHANFGKLKQLEDTPADISIVKEYPDGMKMVRIMTPKGLDRESAMLRHCVGGGGYDRLLTDGGFAIYSLRTKDNVAVATLECAASRIRQIRGMRNGAPDAKYHDHIIRFCEDNGYDILNDRENVGLPPL